MTPSVWGAQPDDTEGDERASILVVDDLPEKLLVFGTVLEELCQEIVFVRSGADALRQVLAREFAVILLDVNMPDIDGFETASLIRGYRRSAHTPIIFITAYADEMQTHRGYELGAVDYILSPVVPAMLRSKVRVFVELHLMQRRLRRQAEQRVALAAAQAARRAAEENMRRAAFLARVSHALSGTLDMDAAMRQLLELLVPDVASCAALLVPQADPARRRLLVSRASAVGPGAAAVQTMDFRLLPGPLQRAFDDALNGRRRATVPVASDEGDAEGDLPGGTVFALALGGSVLGALLIADDDDPQQAAMLEELASRAAVAFENARLYRSLRSEVEERRQAEARLQEANQRKDEFLAMLSHELRNPLAPIRNAVEVIRRIAPPDPKLAWATDVTERQTNHLARLVEELLDVARISQGKITLQMATLELLSLITHSVETAHPTLDARGHRLLLSLPSSPVWLRGDFARLSQVVGNLLDNAAKYTPEGGTIELSLTLRDGKAELSVRDNGMGIEPSLLPNVFELFEQGTRTLDRGQGGLGVGLTLVRRLVELHNGGVEARSAGRGQGAEFIVSLPCLSEVQPAQAMAAGVPSQAKPGADGCRVLVVDDNLDAADTVAMFLRTERHVVLTANDGAQALACAASFAPEVVLLDIGLPGLDGYAVARSLRQLPVTRDALLIALTGYGQQSDRAKAREAGFNRHLVKPADPHALAEAIVQWRMASKREPGAATGA
jgi:signal transduction histidine kinase/DNA-binding response OmpR family regulator